jgi:hypothetical protein|tara:strand:+ start:7 stop:819 length:813 start_codon:yes stop_codon:yes gene_type:complete
MAKRKPKSKRPQPQHKKPKKSQHDKHKRLQRKNPNRKKTTQAKVPLTGLMHDAVAKINVGRTSEKLATVVLGLVVHQFVPDLPGRITVGLDDSPTARYGKHVEGAGVHHNPTPGPADGEWLYGHNWVSLAWLATHPAWGVIALPLRSLMYVLEIDVSKLVEKYDWEFRTKHQLGVELLTWFITTLRKLGVKTSVWLVVDGAYAARPFLLPILELGIVIVSRLRRDACLFDLPAEGSHGNRIYGKHKISLAKRAGHGTVGAPSPTHAVASR